ncbi:hypothetical protein ACWDNI_11850 [Nocardia niigatensis]
MAAVTGTRAEQISWLDERLLALDPDLEQLFAEVDDILRGVLPRPPRPGPAPGPRLCRRVARGSGAGPGGRIPEPVAPGGRGPPPPAG